MTSSIPKESKDRRSFFALEDMYVTRPLSHYKNFPNSLSDHPEGPNSGYLVIEDEDEETYCCFGLCKNRRFEDLPFPQNKNLIVRYKERTGHYSHVSLIDIVFIPVLNFPLSSNRYYAIKPHGKKHKGEALTCSREEDMTTCCYCKCVEDVKARPLDLKNIYQQVEIFICETMCTGKGYFYAKSVAPDGFPPYFLRRRGWSIYTKTPQNYQLQEALGINATLRAGLPGFDFPVSHKSSEVVVVGKWYAPFMFIREGILKDQFQGTIYYQITLEQRWEQIYACQNNYSQGYTVNVDATLDTENAYVAGQKAMWDEKNVKDGTIFFTVLGKHGEETSVGLKEEVVQRMKWEQERARWLGGENGQVKVSKEELYGGNGNWKEFGCYVLVESFAVRRMKGSVALTYEFVHAHQLRNKWE